MARKFAKLLVTVWLDDEFLDLTDGSKLLYLALISQPDITPAGVVALTERRWRRYLDGGLNAVSDALDELHERRFVLLDDDTAEVWVRTFIRHDGRLENENLAKSVHSAMLEIRSETLRTACREQYPDITPGRRASEGRPDGVGKGSRRDVELLEPASSKQDRKPVTSSQQPRSNVDGAARAIPIGESAAAAALDLLIEHKVANDAPRNPTGYRNSLPSKLQTEHGLALEAYLIDRPEATPAELARHVLGLTELDLHRITERSA